MKKIILALKDDLKSISKYTLVIFVVLTYWEMLLYYNLHNSLNKFTIYNVLFMLAVGVVVTSFLGWHKKINSLLMIVMVFVISIFYVGNLLYYKTFGSLLSISMIKAGNDAITNFWWSIVTTIKENVVMIILFELPVILLVIEEIKFKKLNEAYKYLFHPFVLIIGVGLWFLVVLLLPLSGTKDYTPYGAYHSRFVDTDTASSKLGILPNALIETRYALIGSSREVLIEVEEVEIEKKEELIPEIKYHNYHGLDFRNLIDKAQNNSIKNICEYLNTLTVSKENEYTAMFEGYNLIYICGESFSNLAIDKDITPTLYKLANGGFVLNNYYNAFKNVTTNGEYALLTGLWPDVAREETNMGKLTGTMGQSIDKNMSQSLGNMFKKLGINCYGYHNYIGSYYGRNKTLPNMGLDCKFMNDGMTFTTSWPASDLEMMEQSVDDYINEEQFLAYYMTFSGHGNYSENNVMVQKNIDYVKEKIGNRYLSESALGYYACNVELDKALEYLIDRLTKANKLDKTVIVLAGDHYPYYLTDYGYESITGKKISDDMSDYQSSCIIYNSAMAPVEVNEPCCNVDVLPTILNLFGIYYDSRLYAGSDVLSNGKHVAMLYNKSFITDEVKYDATNGNVTYLKEIPSMTKEEYNKYIDNYNTYVKNKYAFSINVEKYDFYEFVFDNYTIVKDTSLSVEDIEKLEKEKLERR